MSNLDDLYERRIQQIKGIAKSKAAEEAEAAKREAELFVPIEPEWQRHGQELAKLLNKRCAPWISVDQAGLNEGARDFTRFEEMPGVWMIENGVKDSDQNPYRSAWLLRDDGRWGTLSRTTNDSPRIFTPTKLGLHRNKRTQSAVSDRYMLETNYRDLYADDSGGLWVPNCSHPAWSFGGVIWTPLADVLLENVGAWLADLSKRGNRVRRADFNH